MKVDNTPNITELADYKLIENFASGRASRQVRLFLAALSVGFLLLILIPNVPKEFGLVPAFFFACIAIFAGWSKIRKNANRAIFVTKNGERLPARILLVKGRTVDDSPEIAVEVQDRGHWHLSLHPGEIGADKLIPDQPTEGIAYLDPTGGQPRLIQLQNRLVWQIFSIKEIRRKS